MADLEIQQVAGSAWEVVTLSAAFAGAGQFLGTEFAIDEGALFAMLGLLQGMSPGDVADLTKMWHERMAEERKMHAELQARDSSSGGSSRERDKGYEVQDGIAYVPMAGVMTKHPTCMSMMFGDGASTTQVRLALRQADQDSDVVSKMLRIDESPGGSVSGAFDLAHDVARAGRKPTDVYVEDMAASGAYLVSAGARSVHSNVNAALGSVGVYTKLVDSVDAHTMRGLKVHVVKAGRFKAAGASGTEVTADQIANMQQRVDAIQSLFVRAVRRGRPGMSMEQLAEVADAGIWIGKHAHRMGLIDGVATMDAAHSKAVAANKEAKEKGVATMAVTQAQLSTWLADETPASAADDTQPATGSVVVAAPTLVVTPPPQAAQQPPASDGDQALLAAVKRIGVGNLADLRDFAKLASVGLTTQSAARVEAKRLATAALRSNDPARVAADTVAIAEAEAAIDASSYDTVVVMAAAYKRALEGTGLAATSTTRPQRLTVPAYNGAVPPQGDPAPAGGVQPTSQQQTDAAVDHIIVTNYAPPKNSNMAAKGAN